MKRELITVCIVALLLVSMMPMASAASSGDQRFRAPVYLVSGCSFDSYGYPETCTNVGAKVGAVSFGPIYGEPSCNEHEITYTISKLEPNKFYELALMSPYSGGTTSLSKDLHGMQTNENGRIKVIEPTCDNGGDRADTRAKLDSGYFIGIVLLPVG